MNNKEKEFDLKCKKCGVVLNLAWNYCPFCGNPLPWAENPDDKRRVQPYTPLFVCGHRTKIHRRL